MGTKQKSNMDGWANAKRRAKAENANTEIGLKILYAKDGLDMKNLFSSA